MAIAGKTYTDQNGKKYWMDSQSEGKELPYEKNVALQAQQLSIETLVEMLEMYRFSAQQLILLGHAAGKLGNAWITEMSFTEAIELEPDNSQAYGDVISYHAAQNQWNTAREFWEQGMLKASEKHYIHYHYGRALFMQELYQEAVSEALEGLQELEYNSEEFFLLALHSYLGVLSKGKKMDSVEVFSNAKNLWSKALMLFPESDGLIDLGNVLSKDEFEV